MAAVATLLDRQPPLRTLRRALPRAGLRLVPCRSADALLRLLQQRILEAIVVSPEPDDPGIARVREQFPAIPMIAFAPFRPGDGEILRACGRSGLAGVMVEGVDDAVAGELTRRVSLSSVLAGALADAPRALRLRDPLQRQVWELLLTLIDRQPRTVDLARRLGITRDHLSRQFGAGGAPNLKRVMDLVRVAAAAILLRNPGYTGTDVARLLDFSSASHLGGASRRIGGLPVSALATSGPRGVLEGFAGGRGRSRRQRAANS
ncbi:MAG: helix-turn-helix domain-containing protein [Gemmatimonadales bacterium]